VKPSSELSPSATMRSRTSKAKCLRSMLWMNFSLGSLPGKDATEFEPGVNTRLTHSISQEKILEEQCGLFISSFKDPKTVTRVREIVDDISDGSSPHCGSVLKLGLKKAFELKKQQRQPPGVLLQCTYSGCGRYNTHVTHASIGSGAHCQYCRRYLQCVGCGYVRNGGYTSCQSCGKKFL